MPKCWNLFCSNEKDIPAEKDVVRIVRNNMLSDIMEPKKHAIQRYYRTPALSTAKLSEILSNLQQITSSVKDLLVELCYHIETSGEHQDGLNSEELAALKWILADPFHPELLTETSQVSLEKGVLVEIGPRFNFSTAQSTNCVAICRSLGLKSVCRVEVSKRYFIKTDSAVGSDVEVKLVSALHDRMTECRYTSENLPKDSFDESLVKGDDIREVDVLGKGKEALQAIDAELGLAFDAADLDYYTNLFQNVLRRNPTTVECFDLAQSNSEHSRHWFFRGKMIVDGVEHEESLIDMIIGTQANSNVNNVIKFSDNSSAIKGYSHKSLRPAKPGTPCEMRSVNAVSHLTFTAETHNFPTGVAPFSGATTGPGGRIRDVQSVGRGGYCIAGTAGYAVGNLNIPDYPQPWEDSSFTYPTNFAPPLSILVEASNGASDYGNKFGEPLIAGYVRSFGARIPADGDNNNERREWIKPIMFSGGIGCMEAAMTEKLPPQKGDVVAKIGGPAYRIGVGGGAASSVEVQGDNNVELDFNAVQRGDAEMENKLNRVVRACLELNTANPILSIHDQGAGGNGNVLKELVEPEGAVVYAGRFDCGDRTLTALELWGAEYQESNALLCKAADMGTMKAICARERCPVCFVGEVSGTGRMVLSMDEEERVTPFDLNLELVLGKMPRKVYKLNRQAKLLKELALPDDISIYKALERVLRLPSVASKRYLTNKVDRCVTGLVAQQQCVGPLHTPLADVAVTAISNFGYEGIASSIGEQPIKGLVDTAAGARMSVGEALSNLVFAQISDLRDVKCSGNWMWAAKLPGEGAALYDACVAMTEIMSKLGIAIDGGKDSLSMAARVGGDEGVVKAPGALVISTYAPCPDVRKVVTPDLKAPSMGAKGQLLYVDLSGGRSRLGGSALAQCYQQLGNETPDLHSTEELCGAFRATQELIGDDLILAGHDVSDGGLITCLLEMCFAGISGIYVNVSHREGKAIPVLFSEELGWVLEVKQKDVAHCIKVFQKHSAPVYKIGTSVGYGIRSDISITVHNACIESTVLPLMRMWEETGHRLELRQTSRDCALAEFNSLAGRKGPKYNLTYNPDEPAITDTSDVIKVAVLREEGSNGDREMAAALVRVGFRVWDVTMADLLAGTVNLSEFRGVIFPGGFSYADVLGSAKGWAAAILFHPQLRAQFSTFSSREDTFSLGVCNGCQLMALLGWIGDTNTTTITNNNQNNDSQCDTIPSIQLAQNLSERFECRWATVKVPEETNSVMLKGMEGSVLGVWVAHGEGRFTFRNETGGYEGLVKGGGVALQYVDDEGAATEQYPMNPNGSVAGLAGVSSANGRHLALMPHPERCDQLYQWPYVPPQWNYEKSPWERLFRNAFDWCVKSPKMSS